MTIKSETVAALQKTGLETVVVGATGLLMITITFNLSKLSQNKPVVPV